MRVYLIGMMGSGKSTVGKKLAMRLGYRFMDLDQQIEESVGQTVEEIFEEQGEETFRALESMALKNLSQLDNFVMATGGGTPCFHKNMKTIRKTGPSIYLKAEPAFLASRVQQGKGRPLVEGLSGQPLIDRLLEILTEREPFYEKAKFSIGAMGIGNEQIEEMVRMIGKR